MKKTSLFLLFLIVGCRKRTEPAKVFNDCQLQYSTSKWLQSGDSIVVPICPGQVPAGRPGLNDSISFTYHFRDSGEYYNTRISTVERWSNYRDTFWIDEHHWFSDRIDLRYTVEKYTNKAILFRVIYNCSP